MTDYQSHANRGYLSFYMDPPPASLHRPFDACGEARVTRGTIRDTGGGVR